MTKLPRAFGILLILGFSLAFWMMVGVILWATDTGHWPTQAFDAEIHHAEINLDKVWGGQ
jgi:hypothetical protein